MGEDYQLCVFVYFFIKKNNLKVVRFCFYYYICNGKMCLEYNDI